MVTGFNHLCNGSLLFSSYLFVCDSLLLLWDFLVDVENSRDVEFHAVKIVPDHSPQPVQTRVARLSNLEGDKVDIMLDFVHISRNFVKILTLK